MPEQRGSIFRGTYDFQSPAFEWGKTYQRPNLVPEDVIVYEMGVRSFTAAASSGLPEGSRGTFKGLIEKVVPDSSLQYLVAGWPCKQCL